MIDCDTCEVRGLACGDCVVTFLTVPVRGTGKGVTMDDSQAAAVCLLAAGGLVPPLRLVPARAAS